MRHLLPSASPRDTSRAVVEYPLEYLQEVDSTNTWPAPTDTNVLGDHDCCCCRDNNKLDKLGKIQQGITHLQGNIKEITPHYTSASNITAADLRWLNEEEFPCFSGTRTRTLTSAELLGGHSPGSLEGEERGTPTIVVTLGDVSMLIPSPFFEPLPHDISLDTGSTRVLLCAVESSVSTVTCCKVHLLFRLVYVHVCAVFV